MRSAEEWAKTVNLSVLCTCYAGNPPCRHQEIERILHAYAREVGESVREEAEKIARSFQPTRPSPIGPLHGAGIAFAVEHIAAVLRQIEVKTP